MLRMVLGRNAIGTNMALAIKAAQLASHLRDGDVVLLNGDLGAGKTYFVQAVAAELGCADAVTSPTFNIMQEYDAQGLKIIHFDLYRLDDASQLEDIDFYYATDSCTPGVTFIEWSDKFADEMPDDALHIQINVEGDSRNMNAWASGERSAQLLADWMND